MGRLGVRRAAADQAWRTLGRERQLKLTRLASNGVPPLAPVDEVLPNGLTVLCGLNGVGKSTLLRLIEATLNGPDSLAGRCRPELLVPGSFSVGVVAGVSNSVVSLGSPSPISALVFDAFALCSRLARLALQPNYQDLFEGVEPRPLSEQELTRAGYVVGMKYDSAAVYEVEEPGSDGELSLAVPMVSRNGVSYDFTAMGTGELAALSLLWHLRSAPPGSIVLLEEPETFLSSHAAVALVDVLADEIGRRRLYAVVTTHSMDIVTRVPLEYVRVIITSAVGSTVRRPGSQAELEWFLGSVGGQARLALVEDTVAAIFTSELLGRRGGLWGQSIAVEGVGGSEPVVALCRLFPRASNIRVVGILDGDQTGRNVSGTTWPILFLPGSDDPNTLLKHAAIMQRDLFSERLARPRIDVDTTISRYESVDPHDWFAEVSSALHLSETVVLRAAIDCWIDDPESDAAAARFVQEFTRVITELV